MSYETEWAEAKVVSIEKISPDVKQIEIQPLGGAISYRPGAHVDVEVVVKGRPETRSYSLVGLYEKDKAYRIAVKLLEPSRGGSVYMWQLKAGDTLKLSAPKNNFELSFNADRYILIAGGIGITPIVGMAKLLSERKKNVEMIYVGRYEEQMPYLSMLKELLKEKLTVHASEKNNYSFDGLVAGVHTGTQMYICGPMGLMDTIKHLWETNNLPPADLRYETFGASGKYAPETFKIKVPSLGLEITVDKNENMLDALTQAGIDMIYDCLKGECGLCAVDILTFNGIIDHRDFFFSEHQKNQNKKMCTCVSRVVKGDVVIDTAYRGNKRIDSF